jgi:hypothetical protein
VALFAHHIIGGILYMALIVIDNIAKAVHLAELYRQELHLHHITMHLHPNVTKWRSFPIFKKIAKFCDKHNLNHSMYIKAGWKLLYPSEGYLHPLPRAFSGGHMLKLYKQYESDMKVSYGRNWTSTLDNLQAHLDALYDSMYWYNLIKEAEQDFTDISREPIKTRLVRMMIEHKRASWEWLYCQDRFVIPHQILPELEKWIKSMPYDFLHRITDAYRVKLQNN